MKHRIILFLLLLLFVSYAHNAENIVKISDNKLDSLNNSNLYKNDSIFKAWMRDTLSVLKRNGLIENKKMTENDSCLIVYEDSLSFEILRTFETTINSYDKLLDRNTIIGSTILRLKYNKVLIPKNTFTIRIAWVDTFVLSFERLISDKDYYYEYVSITPFNSNIETVYTLIKGNLTSVDKQKKVNEWIPKDW